MNTCVCCGAVIPEGRMICWACENGKGVSPERTNDMKETMNPLYAVLATGAAGEAQVVQSCCSICRMSWLGTTSWR